MESPFETLEWHVNDAHSGAISHAKPVLPKRTQNLDPLLSIGSGDWLEDWKFQISAAISWGPERISSSTCWGKNGFCLAQEDQEQGKQLARIQRVPPQRRLKFSPLALMLSHSEGRHYNTSAHWCLWQCDGGTKPDPNKHRDQWWLGLHMLTPQHSTGHRPDFM